jgi:hypothetical protein
LLQSILDIRHFEKEDAPSSLELPGLWLLSRAVRL